MHLMLVFTPEDQGFIGKAERTPHDRLPHQLSRLSDLGQQEHEPFGSLFFFFF